jgi:hypothetical protein
MKIVRRHQQGVVLFVALIVLIIMTLAGLALLRQMGAGTSIAGNIAFKENATSVADRGTEVARQWIRDNTAITANDALTAGYHSSWTGSVDPTTFVWTDAQSRLLTDAGAILDDTQTGNTARIIIQRLCETPNMSAIDPAQRCSDSLVANGGSRGGGGYPSILPSTRRAVLPSHDARPGAAQHDQLHAGPAAVSGVRTHQEKHHEKRRALIRASSPGPARAAALLAMSLALTGPAGATDISQTPILASNAAQVKPNIMLLMDASGSMGRTHMPDEVEALVTIRPSIGYKAAQCNALYFNPDQIYLVPKRYNGRRLRHAPASQALPTPASASSTSLPRQGAST